MNATAEEIDRYLAENVCGWKWNGTFWLDGNYVVHGKAWKPTRDRNHLAEVLAKLLPVAENTVHSTLWDTWNTGKREHSYTTWLLTADPLTVCRAIYQALNKQETRDE